MLVVGLIVGAGIFRAPPLVAAHAADAWSFLLLWVLGGIGSVVGALCYAELATAYPHPGGEYHVLRRAFGHPVAFLLGWARLTVLQTGSIALLAFVFADYAVRLLPGGGGMAATSPAARPLVAVAVIVLLTTANARGIRPGRRAQYALTAAEVVGLCAVILAGFAVALKGGAGGALMPRPADGAAASPNLGLALVFVLLTYGGWSEAAYLSAELRDERQGIRRTLTWGVAAVTALYLLANAAFVAALGFGGLSRSTAVAVDVMRAAAGSWGAAAVGGIVMVSTLSSVNATMITGARGSFAVGLDAAPLSALGVWRETDSEHGGTPRRALVAQAGIALLLVGLGAATRTGFETMVAYTAPMFWLTLLLMGGALFVLRRREPDRERPYRVPLYPLTPLLFCVTSAALLYSSVRHAGRGALLGVAVTAVGLPVLLVGRARVRRAGIALGTSRVGP